MDNLEKGSWIINTTKHLNNFKSDAHELDYFQNTIFAGKTSLLMNKLVSTSAEIIPKKKFNIFARKSFIETNNIEPHLKMLKEEELIDYSVDSLGRPKEIENYCFSNEESIKVASSIFNKILEADDTYSSKLNIEEDNIHLLEETFKRPLTLNEVGDIIRCEEDKAKILLEAHEVFGITKRNNNIIFNEYIFTGNCDKIVSAVGNLKQGEKDSINEIIKLVGSHQGLITDKLVKKFDKDIINLMIGIGMLDSLQVTSNIGKADFVTTPQLIGRGIGKFNLSSDIFHNAKLLLSCLRFGQERSYYGRGKINTEEKMINIIRKLNRGEWLRPCTAAGEDYTVLEDLGVLEIKPACNGMWLMRLKNLEVGKLVESMILYNKVIAEGSEDDELLKNINAKTIITPEERRNQILAKPNKRIESLQQTVLYNLRG